MPLASQRVVPIFFILRRLYSVTGVFPLFLFLFLQYVLASLLLFASKDIVQSVILFQSHPVVLVSEFLFLSFPLIFHFGYGLLLIYNGQLNLAAYPYEGNLRYVMERVVGVLFIVFLSFHIYQSATLLMGDMMGYQFLQDMILAHRSPVGMVVYWMALLAAGFYFCQRFWGFCIDWGWTPKPLLQRFLLRSLKVFWILMATYTVFLVGYQLFPESFL